MGPRRGIRPPRSRHWHLVVAAARPLPTHTPLSLCALAACSRLAAGNVAAVIRAVVFDLDGLLLDSEQLWDEAREELARERGGRWHDGAQRDMMGMSSPEWSRYMHDQLGVPDPPAEISAEVVRRLERLYRERLPLIPGAGKAVERLAERWSLALA